MTTSQIMTDLAGISYGTAGTFTVETKYKLHDIEFTDFTKYPLVIIESGPESAETVANLVSHILFMPSVYIVMEAETAGNLETWRDSVRSAIMNSATLRSHSLDVQVIKITPYETEDRKLQYIRFDLQILIEAQYT